MDEAHARAQQALSAQHAADVAALQNFPPPLPLAGSGLPLMPHGGMPNGGVPLSADHVFRTVTSPLVQLGGQLGGQVEQAPNTIMVAQPPVSQQPSGSDEWKRSIGTRTGNYKCSRCGQPKKNHTCQQPPREKGPREPKNVGWRLSEDQLIKAGVEEHGFKWSAIAANLPNRTDNAVRNRWHRMERARKFREELTHEPEHEVVAASAPGAAPMLDAMASAGTALVPVQGSAGSGAAIGVGESGQLVLHNGGGMAMPTAPAATRPVATAKLGGYRCSKCNQPKKGHICTAAIDPPPVPPELAAAAAAAAAANAHGVVVDLPVVHHGGGGVVGVDVHMGSIGGLPGAGMDGAGSMDQHGQHHGHAAAVASAAAAEAAAAAVVNAQLEGLAGPNPEQMVFVGNRVVSASEGAAVDYLTTFGYGGEKRVVMGGEPGRSLQHLLPPHIPHQPSEAVMASMGAPS